MELDGNQLSEFADNIPVSARVAIAASMMAACLCGSTATTLGILASAKSVTIRPDGVYFVIDGSCVPSRVLAGYGKQETVTRIIPPTLGAESTGPGGGLFSCVPDNIP